jgi:hypothetical protein
MIRSSFTCLADFVRRPRNRTSWPDPVLQILIHWSRTNQFARRLNSSCEQRERPFMATRVGYPHAELPSPTGGSGGPQVDIRSANAVLESLTTPV